MIDCYAKVDDAIRLIVKLGKGALMAKVDIKNAYRIVPIDAGTRQRLPITIAILRKLYSILNLNDYTDALFWAACLTGFFGFLRCGEFTTKSSHFDINTSLSLADLQVDKHLNRR